MKEYKCKTDLLKSGWSSSMIEKLYGKPDKTKRNSFYYNGPPISLYLITKIEMIEKTEEYKLLKEKFDKRSSKIKLSIDKQKKDFLNQISNNITIESIEEQIKNSYSYKHSYVVNDAIESYNNFHSYFDDFEIVSINSDKDFLERITVNYIRHNLTNYEDELLKTFNKFGKHEVINLIKYNVLIAISNVYPHLKDECKRQIDNIN